MRCKCGKESTIKLPYTPYVYCDACFSNLIEKRIKKEIRVEGGFKKNATVFVEDESSPVSEALLHILSKILSDLNCTIKRGKGKPLVNAWTADDEATSLLARIMGIRSPFPEGMRLLKHVLLSELITYCKINDIKYEKKHSVSNEFIMKQLNIMEEKYPDIKFSTVKSAKKWEELTI